MADEKIKTLRRVPTISVTVIRDGKRQTPPVGKAFPFTEDEIKSVTAQHPTAFRKPVNEDAADPATTPEHKDGATATTDPKKPQRKKAAERDSQAAAATGDVKPAVGEQGGTSGDDDADEDDDI